MKIRRWIPILATLGVILYAIGCYLGLFVAPAERYMGDVQRIMYVHVPCAWVALVMFTSAFGFAIASLWSGNPKPDAVMTGLVEVGVMLNCLLLVQGMIWAKATWGVWWDWDVRLTTSLIMALLFSGVLVLRAFIDESERRARWSAITTILCYIDVPLVYFCVRWWRSLHQVQSSPETVDAAMVLPLRINSFAVLFFALAFVGLRAHLELKRRALEDVAKPERLPMLEETADA